MIKRIVSYFIICALAFIIGFLVHDLILNSLAITLPFILWRIYFFQAVFTLSLCILFDFIQLKVPKLSDQLGFLYLGSMVFKITVFCVIFNGILFSSLVLTKADSLSMLIPIFIFLAIEVLIIVKILNRNH